MVYFQTKNTNSGKFWRDWQWMLLVYFMDIWSILQPFGIFCGTLVHFARFGMLNRQKSGIPGRETESQKI
jgi:hypothetical protein